MLIGYARVSTQDQTLNLQKDALAQAGCTRIFTDTASGAKTERKGLDEALNYVRTGDTLVVWRLDRLGRSLKDLIATMTELSERGIGFKSLTEQIDTTTSGGKLIFHIFGALAEFERNLIRERTQAGLSAARARGRKGGRPKALRERRLSMAQALLTTNKTRLLRFARPSRSLKPPCTGILRPQNDASNRATGNPKAVQDQLRHKEAKMTLRYLKTLSSLESLKIQQKVDFGW
jgi:DNA invertase Pin-like site-specific DNA recombinase